ncbi:hypothetical protein GCM10010129_43700 [Streptomyces fumigatiscleroticus]|nr:hypothetical protein GCM10010129_43700 [Streptomyces fumigatiscleroticus]
MPFVEQQMEHVQYGGQPLGQQVRRRHTKPDARVGDLLLGPEKALAHGAFRHQERTRDLGGAHTGRAPQGQRHLSSELQRRMAASEEQFEALDPVLDIRGAVVLSGGVVRVRAHQHELLHRLAPFAAVGSV